MVSRYITAPLLVCSGLTFSTLAEPPQFSDAAQIVVPAQPVGIPKAQDINGDGIITMEEFVSYLSSVLSGVTMRDLDEDGAITPTDARMNMVRIMAAMFGDLDHDGVSGALDREILLRNLGRMGDVANFDGDVDMDGDIDADDLQALDVVLGQDVEFNEEWAVRAFGSIISYGMWLMEGSVSPHIEYFSNTWPNDHDGTRSTWWPANHDGGITSSWFTGPPLSHNELQSEFWPANHYFNSSQNWDIHSHETDLSSTWPANHWYILSDDWPDEHSVLQSRTWPPNHNTGKSNLFEDSVHHFSVSMYWGHDEAISLQRWPPNHSVGSSGTWPHPDDHVEDVSAAWPAGHFRGPSGTWVPNDLDSGWPPNHFKVISSTWPDEVDGIPWFPPSHDVTTTIIDAVPVLD